MPTEHKLVVVWRCDVCGRRVEPLPEFTSLEPRPTFDADVNPAYPHDADCQVRVHYEYVNPGGFILNAATTCHTCRVRLLEEALERERSLAAKEKESDAIQA